MNLERLTSILEFVSQAGETTVADICAGTGLPKPTVYRMVQDLVEAGLLDAVSKGRFVLGARLKRLTDDTQSDQMILDVVAPALKQAAQDHGAAFFLSRLRGRAIAIIHVETPDTGVSYLHPGLGKRPLHACSCSKAVAAFCTEPDLTARLEGRLKAYTDFTLTDPFDLAKELQRIRALGYAECIEEIERGMCSVAAPLHPEGTGATLSIGATGSARVFHETYRAEIGAELCQLATRLSGMLGLASENLQHTG